MFNLLIACLIISLSITTSALAESKSPLRCQSKPGLIACQVLVDEAAIEDVEYNRGNCASPEAAEISDFDDVRLFIGRLKAIAEQNGGEPEKIQDFLLDENGVPRKNLVNNKLGTMRKELIGFGVSEDEADRYLTAYKRIGNDPRGTYRFGDAVSFRVPYNCNLIEYSIAINGKVWRFSDF